MDLSSRKILSKLTKDKILIGSGLQSVNRQRSVCQNTDQLRTNQNCNGCCSLVESSLIFFIYLTLTFNSLPMKQVYKKFV